jgi:CBS domain containing-hemolysin-like protein
MSLATCGGDCDPSGDAPVLRERGRTGGGTFEGSAEDERRFRRERRRFPEARCGRTATDRAASHGLHPRGSTVSLDIVWRLALAPILIGVNAFFVTVEFALTRLAEMEITEAELEESSGLRRAVSMLDRLELHLTGCQLGISLSSVLLGVLAEPAVTELIEPAFELVGIDGGAVRGISVGISVVLLNLAHKIWGEQAPTYLGIERPKAAAAELAPILYRWSRVMKPIIRLGDSAAKWTLSLMGVEVTRSWTREEGADHGGASDAAAATRGGGEPPRRAGVPDRTEMKRRMAHILTRGQVPPDRRKEVMASLEIDEIPCTDITVGQEDLVALALDVPLRENLERIGEGGHVRYPVLKRDSANGAPIQLENVAGVLYLPAMFSDPEKVLNGSLQLEALVEPAVECSADATVAEVIDELQRARQEVALVTREGGLLGIVTITDALERIAGDLEDPLDREGRT